MPIIIPRDGGAPMSVTPLTQEQKQQLWARVVSNWAEQHKEELRPDIKKENSK